MASILSAVVTQQCRRQMLPNTYSVITIYRRLLTRQAKEKGMSAERLFEHFAPNGEVRMALYIRGERPTPEYPRGHWPSSCITRLCCRSSSMSQAGYNIFHSLRLEGWGIDSPLPLTLPSKKSHAQAWTQSPVDQLADITWVSNNDDSLPTLCRLVMIRCVRIRCKALLYCVERLILRCALVAHSAVNNSSHV